MHTDIVILNCELFYSFIEAYLVLELQIDPNSLEFLSISRSESCIYSVNVLYLGLFISLILLLRQ